jgi:hypothetical protein
MASSKFIFVKLKGLNDMFFRLQGVYLSSKQGKRTKPRAMRAKLKASVSHIWPAGCMLCMPDIR